MLRIVVPPTDGIELWDEHEECFIRTPSTKGQTLQLEHSLVSISKWESKWHKPFLSKVAKTDEEILDYIKCMTLTQNVDPNVYACLTDENISQVKEYIDNPMTATRIYEEKNRKGSREVVTNEVIYYWMISLGIPVEFQKWHLNRLLTLIRVCDIKNRPPKKQSTRDIMRRNAELNAARRKKLNSRG